MNTKCSFSGIRWISLLISLIILPIMLSCALIGIPGQNQPPTMAPLQTPQVTVIVVVQSPTPETALLPTNTPEPTQAVEPAATLPVELPTATETATPLPAIIELKNLESIGWHAVNSTKCRDSKAGCWLLSSYKQQGSLTQKEYIYIDPTWRNPYLVFWQKYTSKGNSTFGYLELTTDTDVGWNQIKGINGSNFTWQAEVIDLNAYKGKEISFRINFIPTFDQLSVKQVIKYNEHEWFVSDIMIVPDYQP